ncbi:MAG: hypothetical protein NC483_02815 [Ruminococcus sp.]|nr:hypothetical protein [Ruminococcus sp.]
MKYDDLEKTMDLFDINDIPSPIENIEMEGVNKNTITLPKVPITPIISEEKPEEETKSKKKKEKKEKKPRKPLTKKQKIIMGVGGALLLIIIIVVLVIVLKKDNKEPVEEDKPLVIIEKDNYIYKNGTLTFLDKDEKELGSYTCENKNENLCYVATFSNEDKFDKEKYVYEDGENLDRRTPIYASKYVFIYDNKEQNDGIITLYNILEEKVEASYTLVKGFSNSDYVIVKDEHNKYGAITINDSGISNKVDFTFDYLGQISKDAKLVAKTGNKYYIYSKDGKVESKASDLEIKSYNDKYMVISDNYNVYDYNGEIVIDGENNFIQLLDDYVAVINDNKLYIKDYENHKFNEEGIELDSESYVPTNIYDEDKKLLSTKKAFDIKFESENLSINYMKKNLERNQVISINEGNLSKNLVGFNYFDGALYFYKDEEEKELIGKYMCSNKNNVTKDTTSLTNCMIATESFFSKNDIEKDNSENLGLLPVFNEQYVFVKDSIDSNNPTIILYDLKSNKTLSKYAEVDAGVYTKESKLTQKEADNTYIMAKNKSNKYGVIRLSKDVKSAIPFNYSELSKLGDYFTGKDANNNYVMLDNSGTSVATSTYKITGYNSRYLTVYHDGKYYLSDYDDEKIDNTAYLAITLENDYYVVIDATYRLNIHKYDDPSFELYNPISVDVNNYKNDYEVSKNSSGYIVTIKSAKKTYKIDNYGSELEVNNN